MSACIHGVLDYGESFGPVQTWEVLEAAAFERAHADGTIVLAKGTSVRREHAREGYDPRTHLEVCLFRLYVLDGAHAGECVRVETDGRGLLEHAGLAFRP